MEDLAEKRSPSTVVGHKHLKQTSLKAMTIIQYDATRFFSLWISKVDLAEE